MPGRAVLVAGLPGCGKTTTLGLMKGAGLCVFDDFKAGAHNDSAAFRDSRHYRDLVSALRQGQDCVVADIDFCSSEARRDAEHTLQEAVAGAAVEWLFFANEPATSEANIRRRRRESLEEDIRKLHEYAAVYEVPAGAKVLPVGSAQGE
jgi:hypothetical protein